MTTINSFFVIAFIIFIGRAFANEIPKNIISLEENLEIDNNINEESSTQETDGEFYKEETNSDTLEPQLNQKKLIVIDDIPKEFNEWYGIIPREKGGLGWLMWGNTNHELALALIKNTNFSTLSPTLFQLTSNLLLSRAKKPIQSKHKDQAESLNNKVSQFNYLKEKIKVLVTIGDTQSINKLIDNIPLEIKNKEFFQSMYQLRQSIKDIPFVCNELEKKQFDLRKDILKRKTLIACIIAQKKFSQARLALDLLENDSFDSLQFIQAVRRFLDAPSKDNLLLEEGNLDYKNFKIISLSNYEIAKEVFSNDIVLNKIIFEMKLYSKKNQVEALEKLVNFGFYNATLLKNSYEQYIKTLNQNENLDLATKINNENSLDNRVRLYYLINNSLSDIDRAKYLNLLWIKAKEKEIDKAIYYITKSSLASLIPTTELSWFIYPATKALIALNQIEEAKNWLFFMSTDLQNRATLDINFCKMLILLHIVDPDIKNFEYDIPDINFLLNVLNNSLDLDKETILSLSPKFIPLIP